MSRILFLANPHSTFIVELVRQIRDLTSYEIDIAGFYEENQSLKSELGLYCDLRNKTNPLRAIPKLRVFIDLFLSLQKLKTTYNRYDICHIQYVDWRWGFYAGYLKKISKKLVCTVWGSELNQKSRRRAFARNRILRKSDYITVTNEKYLNILHSKYSIPHHKEKVLRYGLAPLDFINKSYSLKDIKFKLGLPDDKIFISCGANSTPIHNHFSIIDNLESLSVTAKNQCLFLFPMTYGNRRYAEKVAKRLKNSNIRHFKVYKHFLSNEKVGMLRMISDVFIHVPEYDQFSGTMQEHLYAGNVVITGDWLPYDVLENKGIYIQKIPDLSLLGTEIEKVVVNLQSFKNRCLNNKDIICELSTWKSNAVKWVNFYDSLLNN